MFVAQSAAWSNREMAAVLFNIATLLQDRGENPYRVRAYRNGARALMRKDFDALATPLRDSQSPLAHPRGVLGNRLQRRLKELVTTGNVELLDELCEGLPEHIGELMRVPGIGPRLADRLNTTLGIETPEQLSRAARAGHLRSVWGIGPHREAQFAQLSLPLWEEIPAERWAA